MASEEVKMLKSCIISEKGGVPIGRLNKEYNELVGEDIPVTKTGFKDLESYLRSIDGIYIRNGIVTATSCETAHIEKMISKQKTKIVKGRTHQYVQRHQPYNKTDRKPNHNNKGYNTRGYQQNSYNQRAQYSVRAQPCSYNRNNNNHGGKSRSEEHLNTSDYGSQTSGPSWGSTESLYHQESLLYTYNSLVKMCHYVKEQICVTIPNTYYNPEEKFYDDDIVVRNDRDSRAEEYFQRHEIIGDDYMLQVLKGRRAQRHQCFAGLTLHEALHLVRHNRPRRNVVVALGALDVLMGYSGEELIFCLRDLVNSLMDWGSHITVCTVAPLGGIAGRPNLIAALNQLNRFIRRACRNVIDIYALFKSEKNAVNYSLFERQRINLIGAIAPIVPWNKEAIDMVDKQFTNNLKKTD